MVLADLDSFAGRWFVVKLGGELATNVRRLASSVGNCVRQFIDAGIKVAVVHGAGQQTTALSTRLGLQPRTIGGRRITDEQTLEILKMTLAGQASVDFARAFRMAFVPAVATTGISAGLISAKKRPPRVVSGAGPEPVDMGLVGDVTEVRTEAFEKLAAGGFVPVIASLCGDDLGNILNINADTVASRLAARLAAAKLFLVSNVPGVLLRADDPESRIARLTPQLAREFVEQGIISGGMIPKVEESLAMLEHGIEAVHIVSLEPPDALLAETLHPGTTGTILQRA